MLKMKITAGTDLQKVISNYFIDEGYLEREQIDALVDKLTKDLPTDI